MPKVIKKKTPKPIHKEEENIKTIVEKTRHFLERKNYYIIALLGIVLIIAVVYIYKASASRQADSLQYEGYKLYYGLYQIQPISDKERYEKSLEGFQRAYEIKKSQFSLYYMANCYYRLKRYDDAIKRLKELNETFPDDERFVPLTYYKMAMASLKKGNKEDALKYLEILYNYRTASYKDLSLLETGKILEDMGRRDEADRKYETLIKKFSNSPYIKEAEARLKRS